MRLERRAVFESEPWTPPSIAGLASVKGAIAALSPVRTADRRIRQAIAGTTILLAQGRPSRIVTAAATGLAALCPVLFLNRFLQDPVALQPGNPTTVAVRF